MGVFSMNINFINENNYYDEVEMNEGYKTGTDMALALVEARENEFAVLQAGIKQDVLAAMCEDYDERIAINEATASGVLNKIKEILKKLVEKLKAIFHAFVAKLNSFFMDSYKFYKKYAAEISAKNLTDFNIKARKLDPDKINSMIAYTQDKFHSGIISKIDNETVDWDNQSSVDKVMASDFIAKKAVNDVFTDEAVKGASLDEDSDIAKEIEDWVFEDAEDHDNLSGSTIVTSNWIGGLLSKKKFISDIEKTNTKCVNKLQSLVRAIEKDMNSAAKAFGGNSTYSSSERNVKYEGYDDIYGYVINEAGAKTVMTLSDNDEKALNYALSNMRINVQLKGFVNLALSGTAITAKQQAQIKTLISKVQADPGFNSNSGNNASPMRKLSADEIKALDWFIKEKNPSQKFEDAVNKAKNNDPVTDKEELAVDGTLDSILKPTGKYYNEYNNIPNPNPNPNPTGGSGGGGGSTSKTLGLTITPVTNSSDKNEINKAIKSISWMQSYFSKYQETMVKAQNARLSCAKKAVAQAKKIFAAAVAYNPKKESYDLYTAVGESAEFEAMMAME